MQLADVDVRADHVHSPVGAARRLTGKVAQYTAAASVCIGSKDSNLHLSACSSCITDIYPPYYLGLADTVQMLV